MFIELGNRKNREYDSYTQKMEPFINKLSAFFRFICWCKSRVEYQKPIDGYEKQFKNLLDEIGLYGSRLILAGGNFSIDYFAVEELSAIMEKVNQIWYSYDRMERYRLNWKPAYWSFFRIKSLKTPVIAYICGIYKFRYAKNAFSALPKTLFAMVGLVPNNCGNARLVAVSI